MLTTLESIAILNGVAHGGRQDWQPHATDGAVSYRRNDHGPREDSYRWLDEDSLIRVALSYQMESDKAARATPD